MDKINALNAIRGNEICAKIPLIEIAGQKRVLIENHLGILAYSIEEIEIKVSYGKVIIQGQDMTILQLNSEQLVVIGRICAVQICGR